jgi:hypothetical protein
VLAAVTSLSPRDSSSFAVSARPRCISVAKIPPVVVFNQCCTVRKTVHSMLWVHSKVHRQLLFTRQFKLEAKAPAYNTRFRAGHELSAAPEGTLAMHVWRAGGSQRKRKSTSAGRGHQNFSSSYSSTPDQRNTLKGQAVTHTQRVLPRQVRLRVVTSVLSSESAATRELRRATRRIRWRLRRIISA